MKWAVGLNVTLTYELEFVYPMSYKTFSFVSYNGMWNELWMDVDNMSRVTYIMCNVNLNVRITRRLAISL